MQKLTNMEVKKQLCRKENLVQVVIYIRLLVNTSDMLQMFTGQA